MGLLTDETAERLERTFAFVTGSHFINYHYGAILSKSLKVLPLRDFDAQEIVPGLWLGDVYAAHNTKELKKRKITHIVTCTVGVAPPFPDNFKYMHLQILDCAAETIHEHFAETSNFIGKALADGGRVLVHCIRGVSRSATIVAAYLISAMKLSCEEAVEKIREKRPVARPNYGFTIQLAMYAAKLRKQEKLQGKEAPKLLTDSERPLLLTDSERPLLFSDGQKRITVSEKIPDGADEIDSETFFS